jgi:hypothetical protein
MDKSELYPPATITLSGPLNPRAPGSGLFGVNQDWAQQLNTIARFNDALRAANLAEHCRTQPPAQQGIQKARGT